MKKFTFLLTLLLSSIGVNAQDVFQASNAPSETTWAENTTWYKMTLKNGYVVKYDVDKKNYLYARLSEAYGENSWWCLVGDETTGYKLYNKAAGVKKVLGVSKMTEDGKARAEMCDVNDATHGTVFLFNTVNSVNNVFYCKEKTSNEYINQRDNYWSNWTGKKDGVALANGEAGSAIRFYKVEDQNADIQTDLTKAKDLLGTAITKAKTVEGNELGYYTSTKISEAEAIYNATTSTADDFRSATAALTPNNPVAGVLYRLVSAYADFETKQHVKKTIYADGNNMMWGTEATSNPTEYWLFEPTEDGYHLKNAATHAYVKSASELQNAPSSVVTISWPSTDGKPFANIRTGSDAPFHAGNHGNGAGVSSSLMGFGSFGSAGGASVWYIVPATIENVNSITPKAISAKYPTTEEGQVGLYQNTNELRTFVNSFAPFATMSSLDEAITTFNNIPTFPTTITFDNNKYYRFVNVGTTKKYGYDNTLGVKNGKAFCSAGNKENVDFVWQVLSAENGKYNLKNVNSGTYLQKVEDGQTAQTALAKNESPYELRNTELGIFKLYNNSNGGHPAQVETNNQNTNYLNGWDGDNAKWKIYEVTSLEVAMKTVEGKSYATAYLPFGVSAISGAEAYVGKLNAEKNALDMTQVNGVPAEKGFVLVGTADKATLTIGTAAEVASDLQGTNTAITLADDTRANYLVFGKNKDAATEVGFFKPSAKVTSIPANKAYLDASALNIVGAIAMNFGGNTTGVNTVVLGENGVNAPVFDLSGRRVVAPVKGGVYIQNGKKFIK